MRDERPSFGRLYGVSSDSPGRKVNQEVGLGVPERPVWLVNKEDNLRLGNHYC